MRFTSASFIWCLLGLAFLFSRVYSVDKLPLFSDEAYAIVRANEIRQGEPLLGMVKNTTQPIFIWLVALFQLLPMSQVSSGRLVSTVGGLVMALVLARASSKLIKPEAAVVTFILTSILPFAFFYDRTVLFESLTSMFISASLLFPVVFTPLAILTKQTGWLTLPLAIGVNWKQPKVVIKTLLAAVAIPFMVWLIAFNGINGITNTMGSKAAAPLSLSASLKPNLLRAKLWLEAYITIPILILSTIGGLIEAINIFRKKNISSLLIIAVWTMGVIFLEAGVARIFYPRYLYPIVIGIVLLAVRGFLALSSKIVSLRIPLLFFIIFPALRLDYAIATRPETAAIALEDKYQFFEDWTSGAGSQELISKTYDISLKQSQPVVVYVEEENSYYVTLRDDKRLREIKVQVAKWLVDPLADIPQTVLDDLSQSLIIRNRNPDIPDSWPVELILEVPKTASRSVYLYRIVK